MMAVRSICSSHSHINFVTFFPITEHKLLQVENPFETYDKMTFRERYRVPKSVMKCLMDVVHVKLHLLIKFISFYL